MSWAGRSPFLQSREKPHDARCRHPRRLHGRHVPPGGADAAPGRDHPRNVVCPGAGRQGIEPGGGSGKGGRARRVPDAARGRCLRRHGAEDLDGGRCHVACHDPFRPADGVGLHLHRRRHRRQRHHHQSRRRVDDLGRGCRGGVRPDRRRARLRHPAGAADGGRAAGSGDRAGGWRDDDPQPRAGRRARRRPPCALRLRHAQRDRGDVAERG
jgi:hypothetical protein